MRKRLLCIVLVVAMLMNCLPIQAVVFAAASDDSEGLISSDTSLGFSDGLLDFVMGGAGSNGSDDLSKIF